MFKKSFLLSLFAIFMAMSIAVFAQVANNKNDLNFDKLDLKELTAKAKSGDSNAQNALGLRYQNGKGVKQDYSEALNWYKKSAEQGNAEGQKNLGNMYLKGTGIEQDYLEALKWFKKAAAQGHEEAKKFLKEMGY